MIAQDNADEQMLEVRVIVAVDAAYGPTLWCCKVRCMRGDFQNGEHYALAERKAPFNGHKVSFDEFDTHGLNMNF